MRRILGTLILVVALAGCGDDGGTTDQPGTEETEPGLVQMIVLTSAGGEVSPEAYFVDDRAQMKAYVETFEDRDDVASALRQAAKAAEDREGRLAVATVALGCDVPPGVHITGEGDGLEIHPEKVVDPKKECFAATTSIALVEIPTGNPA
jgi:hypothetical protein